MQPNTLSCFLLHFNTSAWWDESSHLSFLIHCSLLILVTGHNKVWKIFSLVRKILSDSKYSSETHSLDTWI
jgi:hypothetical protein